MLHGERERERERTCIVVCVFEDSKFAANNTAFSARGVEENNYETETKGYGGCRTTKKQS